jgi:hypothetical protein
MTETIDAYAQKYLDIGWWYGNTHFHASVKQYLAMDENICDASKIQGAQDARDWLLEDAMKKKVREMGNMFIADDPHGAPMHIDRKSIDRSFSGKGTPNDILMTLWLATHVGQITADPKKLNKRCATSENYALWYLGMDCSGFAMNYLGIDSSIHALDDHSKELRRKELTDIKPGDAMCEGKDYHHIAIVSSTDPAPVGYSHCITVNTWEAYGLNLIGISPHFRYFQKKEGAPGVFLERQPGKGLMETEFYFQPVKQRGAPKH